MHSCVSQSEGGSGGVNMGAVCTCVCVCLVVSSEVVAGYLDRAEN